MKKIIVLFVVLSLVALCGCKAENNATNPTTVPAANAGNSETPTTVAPTKPSFDDIDWESEIDVDDSFLEETVPGDPQETEPTEPGSSEPTPGATEPVATDPVATKPEATTPSKPDPNGPIELPMIPG